MVVSEFKPVEEYPLQLQDKEQPVPGQGEILLKINYCGVCHTDLHTVEGELPAVSLPRIPGHQVVGMVKSLGEGASRFRRGDRVGVAWLYSACGGCRFCRSGRENLCPEARFTGYQVDGGYAEYMVVSEDFAYELPENFPDEQAAPLLCAGIIGYRALRLSRVKPGEKLGLYGFGASAHVTIQVARHWNCRVYVFSRSQKHRNHALELGALWAGKPDELPPEKLDSAIVFAPAGELARLALRAVDRGGTVALAGIYMSPIAELDYERELYFEKNLKSVANATRQDGIEFLILASEIPIRTDVQVYPLDKANQALIDLKHSQINGAGVLKIVAEAG
jgi:propanol-preferring alcohol dehydrogenase